MNFVYLNRLRPSLENLQRLPGGGYALLLLLIPLLFLSTLAQGLVLGDPTEYTFVAHVLAIAHPPGYAFMILMGKLFQTLNPFGDIPWRMHLMSATAATLASLFVYGTVRTVAQSWQPAEKPPRFMIELPALFAAFSVATAANFWQHAIHTNPHIITVTFLATNLFLLTKWWAAERDGGFTSPRPSPYLFLFAFTAGLGVTHHPLTAFSFPAYALFILWIRPRILMDWRTLLKMVGLALLGLSVWLYFPIRSAMEPVFGSHDMNTLEGFRRVVLAEGLRVNLFHFGLIDQFDRIRVFWSLLRLQYSLATITLAGLALVALAGRLKRPGVIEGQMSGHRPLLLLYVFTFLLNYAFIINTVQDVMAYLLNPFLIIGLLAGIGLAALLNLVHQRLYFEERNPLLLLAGALFLLGPALQLARNLPLISLRHYNEGDAYVTAVFDWFDGRNEGAVLLNDWEPMTPLWYSRFVEQRWFDPADLRPEFVSTAYPVQQLVYNHLPGGPVYLSRYRPEIVQDGFRLRARGPFYQVVEPEDSSIPPELTRLEPAVTAVDLEVVAFLLPQRHVTAGDFVPFTLAMRAPAGTSDYYAPILYVGDKVFAFTTDSHLITPLWQAGEVIVERFDFALPHHLAAGDYPIRLDLQNLSANQTAGLHLDLGQLHVTAQDYPIRTDHLLANFRQRVGLVNAGARQGFQHRRAPWPEERALIVQPGDVIHLTFQWQALAITEVSYTVFVHLIDLANRPIIDNLDYNPLGGAAPTHLWIPKWLPGQRFIDPYRMTIPSDLAPGVYLIEVGLYEEKRGRRLHMSDLAGNLVGDRYILGRIEVRP